MLKFQLGRLKNNPGAETSVTLTAACSGKTYGYDDLLFSEPVRFAGLARNRGTDIEVEGQVQAHLQLACARCGEPLQVALTLPFAEIYSWQEAAVDAAGEQDIHHFSGDMIDLTPEVLRHIFQELPMKPLCREDCQGLCPHCGADLNTTQCSCAGEQIDPRWEKLQQFRQDQSAKGV